MNRRINWLLILQGWAMLWVVIGHSGPSATLDDYPAYAAYIRDVAYSFHMYLFVTISGFLFFLTRLDNKRWTYWDVMKDKLVRFGIPFVVFTVVALVLKSVFAGSVDRATTLSIKEFVNAIVYPYNGPMREFWFLATIMWYFAFYPLWRIVLKNQLLSALLLIGFAIVGIWPPSSDLLAIRHVCQYAFFFYAGILCANKYKDNETFVAKRSFIVIAYIAGSILYIMGRFFPIPLIAPIGGIVLSLAICLSLDKMRSKAFCSFRNYTYQIYLLGIYFNVMIIILRAKFGLPFTPMYVISLFLGLYMPVLISKFLEWVNWESMLLCVGLKKKNN